MALMHISCVLIVPTCRETTRLTTIESNDDNDGGVRGVVGALLKPIIQYAT